MDTIRNTIHQYLSEGYTCVFPNETVARFWASDYALRSCEGAIRSDRVLAWDTFRQFFLPVRTDSRPASSLVRQLFVAHLMAQVRGDGTAAGGFRWFAPADAPEADERFSRSLATLLPHLSAVDDALLEQLPAAMVHDLTLMRESYLRFLEDRNLFDPSFERPSLDHAPSDVGRKGPYRIMFSNVIPQCEELLLSLGEPDWISMHPIGIQDDGPRLEVFDNQIQELRTQIRRIESLLERGVPTHDITITCADLPSLQEPLMEEARLRDVPIRIIQGLSPLRYPAGKFFRSVKRVYDERVSLDAVKALLLDPCLPWRDISLHRRLIAAAIKLRIGHGDMALYGGRDQWHDRLSRTDRELALWYDSFKENIRDICTASTVRMLRMQLNKFQDRFFADGQWQPPLPDNAGSDGGEASGRGRLDADVYSFCMKRIDLLADALDAAGFAEYPGLYGMFLRMLEHANYVPQQEQQGISVYDWPVTAGIAPRYHFILNMSHDAVRSVYSRVPFIPETVGDEALRQEQDMTEALLALYRGKDDLQEGVFLSCCRQTYGNVMLPPSWFVEHGLTRSPDACLAQAPDLFLDEQALWSGLRPSASVCTHGSQKQWFDLASRSVLLPSGKGDDMARSVLPDPQMLKPLYVTVGGKALLPLSSTSLDLFATCPFAWACRYLYSADSQDFVVPPVDHRAIGVLIHAIYQRFFRTISAQDAPFDPALTDTYRDVLERICSEELDRMAHRPDAPAPSTLAWIEASLRKQLPAIIEAEAKTFPGSLSWNYEYQLVEVDEHAGYRLEGRIDRILLLPDEDGTLPDGDAANRPGALFAVVDYKKGTVESARQFQSQLEEGTLLSSQLPVYRRLVGTQIGSCVSIGAYYSVKSCRYVVVWNGDGSLTDRIDSVLESRILEMIHAVRHGELAATPSKEHCSDCRYRQVCRRRYSIQ